MLPNCTPVSAKNKIDFCKSDYWINLKKPKHISSAKAVAIVKRITKAKKVGHGGTLDPFATGVLPIAVNKCTKQTMDIMTHRKKYFFQIIFGEFRDSDDISGQTTEKSENRVLLKDFIKTFPEFTGTIKQQPSKFSAIKINGERSYKLAREGKEFEMPWREVNIYSIKLTKFSDISCDLEVECSKGTYIRTLARDLCLKNGICGYVSKLSRLKVGVFSIDKGISLDELKNIINFRQSYRDGSLLDLHQIQTP